MPTGGFTLIELLVAVLLLSMMLVLASVAFRNLLLVWQRFSTPYPQAVVSFYRLQSAIQSMFPYVVEEDGGSLASREGRKRFYFHEAREECTFITLAPLQVDAPSLSRIYLREGEVILSETPLYSPEMDYRRPKMTDAPFSLVLFDNVAELSFSYSYKMEGIQEDLYRFPKKLIMTTKLNDGETTRYIFAIKSNYIEKLRIITLLNEGV